MSQRSVLENTVQQDPRQPSFFADPYSRYTQWHAHGSPVYWENYGFWCLLSFDSVNQALRDRRFARLPPAGHERPAPAPHLKDFAKSEQFSLLAMEPPAHTQLRKLVNKAFVSRQISTIEPYIRTLAHQCIDGLEHDGSAELLEHYATPIPLAVITRLLGVPEQASADLLSWSHAIVKVYTMTQTYEQELAANKAASEFHAYLEELIAKKRRRPGDDLLSHMLAQQHDAPSLSDEHIICVCILLLNAGHEATVHQLGNMISTLLKHYAGERRHKLLAMLKDDAQADAIVAESMRYAAPLHLFTRFAQEDLTLEGGIEIARGEELGLLLAAANRCPLKFSKPNQFIPERTDPAHLSLGAGIHYCVGAHLAKMELRIALQVLFERLPHLTLSADPQLQDSFHFHGLEALHIRW